MSHADLKHKPEYKAGHADYWQGRYRAAEFRVGDARYAYVVGHGDARNEHLARPAQGAA